MLSTKDMSAGSGNVKPVIGVGNQKVKINSITFDVTPYDADAYNIVLHVESEPVQGEFNGFLKDMNNPNGARYEGQVGRVRFSPYPYKDATLPSGREINRDTEVLKGSWLTQATEGDSTAGADYSYEVVHYSDVGYVDSIEDDDEEKSESNQRYDWLRITMVSHNGNTFEFDVTSLFVEWKSRQWSSPPATKFALAFLNTTRVHKPNCNATSKCYTFWDFLHTDCPRIFAPAVRFSIPFLNST